MQEKNSGILEVLKSNIDSSLLNQEMQDVQVKTKESNLGFDTQDANKRLARFKPTAPSTTFKLTDDELKAQEEGYTQYSAGVIRVSDSPTALEDTSFQSTRQLYEQTLGVTQYDSLRQRLGLKDGKSYTDYYNRTGYVPAGFEMEHKMLLAEEKRKKLYARYQAGEIGEADFLYEAYGKDLLKAEGHDVSSSLYWYQRRKDGYTTSVLDNATYMSSILYQARQQFEAEEWFEKSQTLTLDNSLASYLAQGVIPTGETLGATTVRELFKEQFEELDQYYESTQKVIDLYRSGYLSGFNPTIDIDNDGKVDYYYHTNGKLYAIEGSSGTGSAKAYAYYNDDGSLNRITLTGSQAGEIGQQVIKGFTNIFTEAIGFIGMLGGGIVDLVQGITGNGWDLSATTEAMTGWQRFLNNDSFAFGNDGYIVDTGFKTSDGDVNWMAIGRGAASAVGTVAEIALTVVASIYTAGGAGAVKIGATTAVKAASKAGAKAVGKGVTKKVIKEGMEALGEVALKKGMKTLVKETGEKITKEVLEEGIELATKKLLKEGTEEFIEEVTEESFEKVLQVSLKEALEKSTGKTISSTANQILSSSVDDILATAAKQKSQSFLRKAVNTGLNFVLKTTGVANGTPWFTRTAWGNTIESISIMAVKDFLQTGAQLTINQDQLGLSDGEIIGKALGVASLNAAVSLAFRSVQDTTAIGRWAILAQKNANANNKLSDVSKKFLNMVNSWQTKSFKSFMAANTAMDIFENISTMYFQNSMAQTGEMFNAEVFKNTMSNPQMIFTQAAMAFQSVKGGFGKNSEGAETGGILQKIGNVEQITNDAVTYLKKAIQNSTSPEDTKALTDLVQKIQKDINKEGNRLTNLTEVLADLHTAMADEDGNSFVRQIITDAVGKRITQDTIAEMQVATAHYNNMVNAYGTIAKDSLSGKLSSWIHKRRNHIIEAAEKSIAAYCKNFNKATYKVFSTAFDTELSQRPDMVTINDAIQKNVEMINVNQLFEWKDEKGRLVYTVKKDGPISDPEVIANIQKYLQAAQLTVQDLDGAMFIKVKGTGGAAEGTQDYKDITEFMRVYSLVAEQEQNVNNYAKRLLYKLSEKNDLFLVPNLGLGYTMANIHNIGEAIRALHRIKYSPDSSIQYQMLINLQKLFLNESKEPTISLPDLLKKLRKEGVITMSQASTIVAEFDEASYKTLIKDGKPDFVSYKEGVDILKDLEVYASKELTDSDLTKVKNLYSDYINTIPTTVQKQLLDDEVLTSDMLKSIKDIIRNPNQSQNYQKKLESSLEHLFENPSEENIKEAINFLSMMLNTPLQDEEVSKTFNDYIQTITVPQAKEFLGSDLIKGIDIFRLSEDDLETKVLEYCINVNTSADPDATLAEIKQVILNFKTDLLNKLNVPESKIKYDTMLSQFASDNLKVDINREDNIKQELLSSPKFFDYYAKAMSPSTLEERLKVSYDLHQKLFEGTYDVEASPYVYIDLTTLVGATHARLLERLTNPTVRQDLTTADSPTKFIATVFGNRSYQEVTRTLAKEQAALNRFKNKYYEGYVVFHRENDYDLLNKFFKDLGYSYAAISQNETSLIPGVTFKKGFEKALEFKLSQKKKTDLINALISRLGYTSKTVKSKLISADIISQLETLMGGLVYLDDNTVLNPSRIIMNSLIIDDNLNFSSQDSVRELFNALGKQGKLAGAAKDILAISNYEIGAYSKRSKELRDYELLLTAIDSLADLYGSTDMAVSRLLLTDDEALEFMEKGLWDIKEDNKITINTSEGKKTSYILTRKEGITKDNFKELAYKLLTESDTVNLNLICPVYNCEYTHTDLILKAYNLNRQNTLGYSPITKILTDMIGKTDTPEILELFSNTEFKSTFKNITTTSMKEALDFFKGTVGEIRNKEVSAALEGNPYYVMMRNAFEAAIKTSEHISKQLTSLQDSNLLKILGTKKGRRLVGATLFELVEGEKVTNEIILNKLKERLPELTNIEEKDSDLPYLEYLDYSDKESTFFSGNQSTLFRTDQALTASDIDALTVEDIKVLKDLIKYVTVKASVSTEDTANVFVKLWNSLNTSKESIGKSDILHFYINDLYNYSVEEFEIVKNFLSDVLSKKDIAILEAKFNIIKDELDMYNNPYPDRIYGDRLVQYGDGNNATIAHYLQAISYKGYENLDKARKVYNDIAEEWFKLSKEFPEAIRQREENKQHFFATQQSQWDDVQNRIAEARGKWWDNVAEEWFRIAEEYKTADKLRQAEIRARHAELREEYDRLYEHYQENLELALSDYEAIINSWVKGIPNPPQAIIEFHNKNKTRFEEARVLLQEARINPGEIRNEALDQSIKWATEQLENGYKKKLNYKISDVDSITHNSEVSIIKNLASLLNIKVMNGINRQGSLLIQNIELKEKMGQLVNSIASVSAALKTIWTADNLGIDAKTLPSDTFNQIAFAMYMYSTGMDYQSEWTKYLFINLDTGQIETTAQAMHGARTLNDLMFTAKNLFQDVDKNDARYLVLDLEKNMLLSNSPTSGKLKYYTLNKDSISTWRAVFIKNALDQWENNPFYEKASSNLDIRENIEKALFVYASTPTQKRSYEDIITELVNAGVDKESARLAVLYDMDDLQSSKSTNSSAEQLFLNDFAITRSERDRIKFNTQQKAISDVMKYNVTYRGLPSYLQKEFLDSFVNSKVLEYTITKHIVNEKGESIESQTTNKIKGAQDVITSLLSGNTEELERSFYAYREANKDCSDEQLMNALMYTYLYNSKEASAISFLLSGNDFDYFKGLKNEVYDWQVTYKDTTVPLKGILNKGCYSVDIESFFNRKTRITEPFQINITYVDADGNTQSKTIYRPIYVNGKLIETENEIRQIFEGEFVSDYLDKHAGTQEAVKAYLEFVKHTKTIDINKEINSFMKEDLPVLGFNTKGYDNNIMKAIGLEENSFWFKNSLDAYNDIFKKVQTTLDLTNKENLSSLLKQLGLENKLQDYGIKLGSAHDAESDTIATYLVTRHIIDSVINVNEARLDMFYDLEILGKKFLGESFTIDSVKDVLESDDFKLRNTSLESQEFINSYKEKFKANDLSTKTKAIRKLQTVYNTQEREINLKKYRSDYETTFNRTQKEIVTLLHDSNVINNLSKVIKYITQKKGISLKEILPLLSASIRDAFGNKGSFRDKDFKKFLTLTPEEMLSQLSIKNSLLPDYSEEDFKKASFGKLTSEEIEEVKRELDFDKFSNDLYQEELLDSYYSFNKNLNDTLDSFSYLEGTDYDEIKNHIFAEANMFYTDTRDDGNHQTRLRRKRIVDNLTTQQLEFLKEQPVRRISHKMIYDLVQATPHKSSLTVLDWQGKLVKESVKSDTIYVSKKTFKKLMGMNYETARQYYQTQEGEDIYFTAIRHPLDKVDAIQNYKIKVVTDDKVNIMMSPDILKALHGGDNDGDHINLIRPSRATQEFAKTILPITKAAWTVLDSILDSVDLPYTNKRLNIKTQQLAMYALKDVIAQDLEDLVAGTKNYNDLKRERSELLTNSLKHLKLKPKDIEELMEIAWIVQGSEPFKAADKYNYPYYSYSIALRDNERNKQQLQILNDHKSLLRKINSYADSISGVIQKSYNKQHVYKATTSLEDIDKFFSYAPFNLSSNTILSLKTGLENDSFKTAVKNSFLTAIENHIIDADLKPIVIDSINNINTVEDFMYTFRLFEDAVKASNTDIIAEALHKLNTFNSSEDVYQDYDKVLKDYLGTTQGKFFDAMATTEEMIDAITDGLSEYDYFADASSNEGYVYTLIQAKLQELQNSPSKGGFKPTSYDDFKNKTKAKIVYAFNPSEDIPEDTIKLLPGHSAYRYNNIVPVALEADEKLLVPEGTLLKVGDQLTTNHIVTEALAGYKLVKKIDEGYILVKSKGIDGTSKIAIPGSSTTKGTISGTANLDIFKDCFAITRMDEFNFKKLSGETLKNSEIKYYNADGSECKDSDTPAYAVVETNIGIAEDTGFWDTNLKDSILDDVTIGMNSTSLEGLVLLGKYFIPSESLTDESFTLDNSKIVKIEQALERMKSPRYLSTNGTYAYKCLLLATLLEHDTTLDADSKRAILTNHLHDTNFAGVKGTQEIAKRLASIKDLDAFKKKLPSDFQKNLFKEELLAQLFNLDISKVSLGKGTEQTSKKSHGTILQAISGAYGTDDYVSGYLAEQDSIRPDGETIHDIADSFIPLLNLRQALEPDDAYRISSYDIQQLTERNLIPKDKGYSGSQVNGYHAISERRARKYKGDYSINVDPKTGMPIGQVYSLRPHGVSPEPIDTEINTRLTGLGEFKRTSDPKRNYTDTSADRITKYLLAGLSEHNKQDVVSFAYSLFKPEDMQGLSLAMHRRRLQTTDEGEVLIRPQAITGYSNSKITDWYNTIQQEFSTADVFDSYRENYNKVIDTFKDEFDFKNGIYLNLPTLKEETSRKFDLTITPKVYQDALAEMSHSSYMPRDYYEGRNDYMHTVYKEDMLETSGIKLDSEAAINADRIAKYLKSEGESITLELNNQLLKLHHVAETRKVTNELNEYAFLTGTLDRISQLEKIKSTDPNAVTAIEALTKSLPCTIEEAKQKITFFENLYPEIIEPFREVTAAAVVLAQRYAHLTLEPTTNPFFLLVPNIRSVNENSTKGERAYVKSMFFNTSLYINSKDTVNNYPTYAGYNFFQSMPQILKQIANQAAIYNGSQRLKRQGYMQNSSILTQVSSFFKENKNTFENIEIENKRRQEVFDFNYNTLANEFDEFRKLYYNIQSSKTKSTTGAKLYSMYEALNAIIESEGLSYTEARQLMSSTNANEKAKGTKVVKAYEYSNDIIANLCDASGEGTMLLENLGKAIYSNSSYAVVDNWGRILDQDITKFKSLSKASMEYIPKMVQYYIGGKNSFFKNIALEAINGEIYYMPKDLANIMDKEVFTSRPPKTIQKHLIKLQNVAVKLLMSSPFKLLDRVLKYTGFDLSVLSMANAKTLLKEGQARTELSALWSSNGAILNKVTDSGDYTYSDLREFLYTQGIDPNSSDLTKLFQGEVGSTSNKGPLQGYFDFTNKTFSYQNLFQRYAFWLATKEDLQKGRGSYGSIYYKKNLVDTIEGIPDETIPNKMKVSKEGNQAAFIMAQNIGAPGDFPALAKRLQGYATFTTFPLALLRWGKGEIYSMATAFKNIFVEGETKGALKHLAYNGGGILGIYLTTHLLTSLLADIFSIPEEEEEEWKEEQAIPDIFRTIIQGSPVMDTYSSINPLKELGDMTINPIIKPMLDDDSETDLIDGLQAWFLENIVSHANPVVKGAVESISGYDVIGDTIISTKDDYNIWENFARKAGAYLIGSAGANAFTKYLDSYESKDATSLEKISTGLKRAVDAELGNTKVYKSNQKNYYKAMSLLNTYLYAGKDTTYSDNFNQETYKSLKNDISNALHNKAKMTDIYTIIEDYISKGASFAEIKSAINNNSIRYKLTRIDTSNDFLSSLTESELACIKSALAYEDYIFPWLDTIVEDLAEKYNTSYDNDYRPYVSMRYYPNNYYDYDNSYYPNYPTYNSNYIPKFTPYSNFNSYTYSPVNTFNQMMNTWKYGKSTDLYGNKYSGYTNIKGHTWKWEGDK